MPDNSGSGIYIDISEPLAQQIASLADQLQEPVVEYNPGVGLPAVWPSCPEHPNTHALEATVIDDRAWWKCPRTGTPVAEIGDLVSDKSTKHGRRPPKKGKR
jgi:hypothetical protein